MKIVDEKGKLFGKINLIDLIVIVILVAALIFLAVRFLLPSKGRSIGSTTKVVYTVQVQAVDNVVYLDTVHHLEANGGRDQLMANGEMVDGYVTGVSATPHVSYNPTDSGAIVRAEENYPGGRWDLVFTVEANVDSAITSKVGTQEVRAGKSHILKTTHFEFAYGNILTCEWE